MNFINNLFEFFKNESKKSNKNTDSPNKAKRLSMESLESREMLSATILDAAFVGSFSGTEQKAYLDLSNVQGQDSATLSIDISRGASGSFDPANLVIKNLSTGNTISPVVQTETDTKAIFIAAFAAGQYEISISGSGAGAFSVNVHIPGSAETGGKSTVPTSMTVMMANCAVAQANTSTWTAALENSYKAALGSVYASNMFAAYPYLDATGDGRMTNADTKIIKENLLLSALPSGKISAATPTSAQAPTISSQPLGATYTQNASAIALSVTASVTDGGTLSYLWYKDGTAISGATQSSYTPPTTAAGTTSYYCIVTNTKDTKTGTTRSNSVSVVVSAQAAASAAISNATISGVVGTAITSQTITVNLTNDTFKAIVAGTDVKSWITNLPAGLAATIAAVNSGAASATITISGTPTAVSTNSISVTIPASALTRNAAVTATTNTNAKYNIVAAAVNAQTPSITTQPQNASYNQGATASALSVVANVTDGGTLSYQWHNNSGPISGATNSTYTPPTSAVGTQYYYCIVTNTNNSATGTKLALATSSSANVTVIALTNAAVPTINTQPQGASYNQGAAASPLSVSANVTDGGTLSYQWHNSSGAISGATSATYTPPTSAVGQAAYYCIVTNTNNSANGTKTATATTSNATIVVNALTNAAVPTINAQPQNASYNQSATATALYVAANVSDGGTLSYQWHNNSGQISGATNSSYTPPTSAVGTTAYYCVVTNTNNSATGTKTATATTSSATIIVNALTNAAVPTITTQPQGETYNHSAEASALYVAANVTDGGSLTYNWYRNTTNVTTGGTLVGSGLQYVPSTATVGTLYYYCVVTNTNNSATGTKTATATSSNATIIVNALINAAAPTITTQPQGASYNQGVAASALSVTANVSDSGTLSYLWYANGTAISGATNSSYTPPTSAVGSITYYCLVTNTNNSATGIKIASTNSISVTITINVDPAAGAKAELTKIDSNAISSLPFTNNTKTDVEAAILAKATSLIDSANYYVAIAFSSTYDTTTNQWSGMLVVTNRFNSANTAADSANRAFTVTIAADPAVGAKSALASITQLNSQLPFGTSNDKGTVESELLMQATTLVNDVNYIVTITGSSYNTATKAWSGRFVVTHVTESANTAADSAARLLTISYAADPSEGAQIQLAQITNPSISTLPAGTANDKTAVDAAILVLANSLVDSDYSVTIAAGSSYNTTTKIWQGKLIVANNTDTANTATDSVNRVLTINIPVAKSVSVGTISDQITAGTAANATYSVTTASIATGTIGAIIWYDAATGGNVTTVPAGITLIAGDVTSNSATLNLSATTSNIAGSYYFTVSYDGIESARTTLVVAPAAKAVVVSGTDFFWTQGTAITTSSVTVDLTSLVFTQTLSESDFSFSSLPAGVSVDSVTRVSDTQATITFTGAPTATQAAASIGTLTIKKEAFTPTESNDFVTSAVSVNATVAAQFIAVTGVTLASNNMYVGVDFALNATVNPNNATNQTIIWSIKNADGTGATIDGNILKDATAAGTIVVTASVTDGTASGTPYSQDFDITVSAQTPTAPIKVSLGDIYHELTTNNTKSENIDPSYDFIDGDADRAHYTYTSNAPAGVIVFNNNGTFYVDYSDISVPAGKTASVKFKISLTHTPTGKTFTTSQTVSLVLSSGLPVIDKTPTEIDENVACTPIFTDIVTPVGNLGLEFARTATDVSASVRKGNVTVNNAAINAALANISLNDLVVDECLPTCDSFSLMIGTLFQFLPEGYNVVLSIPFTANDVETGLTTSGIQTVIIHGVNNSPDISSVTHSSQTVSYAAGTLSGLFDPVYTVADVDANVTGATNLYSYAIVNGGSVTINGIGYAIDVEDIIVLSEKDGKYRINFAALDGLLATNDRSVVTFDVYAADKQGGESNQMTIIVNIVNQTPPAISVPTSATEAGNAMLVSGLSNYESAFGAKSQTATFGNIGGATPAQLQAAYSQISITADLFTIIGDNVTFNPAAGMFEFLPAGATCTFAVPITATDLSSGLSATKSLLIQVTGVNVAPAITDAPSISVISGQTSASVAVNISDPNMGDVHTYNTIGGQSATSGNYSVYWNSTNEYYAGTQMSGDAQAGFISVAANTKSFTFTPSNDFAPFKQLAQGDTLSVSIPITVKDNHYGISSALNVTFIVVGINDAPTASAPISVAAIDYRDTDGVTISLAAIAGANKFGVSDPDNGDAHTITEIGEAAANGTLDVYYNVTDGYYVGTQKDADVLQGAITVAADVKSFTFTPNAAAFTTAGNFEIPLSITVSDIHGATDTKSVTLSVLVPSMTIGAQSATLTEGTESSATFTAAISNGITGTYSISAAYVSSNYTASNPGFGEDYTLSYNGNVVTFNLLNTDYWKFIPKGSTLELTFNLTATNGVSDVTQFFIVTVTGINQSPVIAVHEIIDVNATEESNSVNLVVSDPDFAATWEITQIGGANVAASLDVYSNGTSYYCNSQSGTKVGILTYYSATQAFTFTPASDCPNVVVTLSVQIKDDWGGLGATNVHFKVINPGIASLSITAQSGTLTEKTEGSATFTATISNGIVGTYTLLADYDSATLGTLDCPITLTLGTDYTLGYNDETGVVTFGLLDTAAWHFIPRNTVLNLRFLLTATNVNSTTSEYFTVAINGINDAPTASDAAPNGVVVGSGRRVDVADFAFSDPDYGDVGTIVQIGGVNVAASMNVYKNDSGYSCTNAGTDVLVGVISFANNAFTFTPNGACPNGDVEIDVTLSDGIADVTKSVTFEVTNDAPTATAPTSITPINFNDANGLTICISENAAENTIGFSDEEPASVTLTQSGTLYAVINTSTKAISVSSSNAAAGEELLGTIAINADGKSFTFTPNASSATLIALSQNETIAIAISVSVKDASGQDSNAVGFDIVIKGVNDPVTITDVQGVSVNVGGFASITMAKTGTPTITIADANTSNTHRITHIGGAEVLAGKTYYIAGDVTNGYYLSTGGSANSLGAIVINADGNSFVFTPNANSGTLRAMRATDTLSITLAFSVTDGYATDSDNIVLTINGTEDAPAKIADAAVNVVAGSASPVISIAKNSGSGTQVVITDPDTGDSHSFAKIGETAVAAGQTYYVTKIGDVYTLHAATQAGEIGTIIVNATATSFTFTPITGTAADTAYVFPVVIADTTPTTPKTCDASVTFTVKATNTAPTITPPQGFGGTAQIVVASNGSVNVQLSATAAALSGTNVATAALLHVVDPDGVNLAAATPTHTITQIGGANVAATMTVYRTGQGTSASPYAFSCVNSTGAITIGTLSVTDTAFTFTPNGTAHHGKFALAISVSDNGLGTDSAKAGTANVEFYINAAPTVTKAAGTISVEANNKSTIVFGTEIVIADPDGGNHRVTQLVYAGATIDLTTNAFAYMYLKGGVLKLHSDASDSHGELIAGIFANPQDNTFVFEANTFSPTLMALAKDVTYQNIALTLTISDEYGLSVNTPVTYSIKGVDDVATALYLPSEGLKVAADSLGYTITLVSTPATLRNANTAELQVVDVDSLAFSFDTIGGQSINVSQIASVYINDTGIATLGIGKTVVGMLHRTAANILVFTPNANNFTQETIIVLPVNVNGLSTFITITGATPSVTISSDKATYTATRSASVPESGWIKVGAIAVTGDPIVSIAYFNLGFAEEYAPVFKYESGYLYVKWDSIDGSNQFTIKLTATKEDVSKDITLTINIFDEFEDANEIIIP